MGFWHTGYIEFHEPVGLSGFRFEPPPPPRFPCVQCGEICTSIDDLRKHRFESHPLRRPVLFLQGREVGAHPVRITRAIRAGQVTTEDCDRAVLNGDEIPVGTVPRRLAQISSEMCRLILSKAEVSSEFTLDFQIASEKDLRGIEEQFERTALGRRLDIRAIEEFISATSRFGSAIGYCDGICAYLYGVLAKERSPDSSLAYEAYVGKFSKGAEQLTAYNRPLARAISSLIEFHFNHFREAALLAGEARVGQAAGRFAAWLQGSARSMDQDVVPTEMFSKLEALVTDWETEQIVRWAIQSTHERSRHVVEIEAYLKRELADYDRVKLHVLLGETYAASGDIEGALKHAKTLRNLSALEKWAESMIQTHSEDHDE